MVSSSLLWPPGGAHHRDVTPDAVEADGVVSPEAFDLPLASGFLPSSAKERDSRVQVVDSEGDLATPAEWACLQTYCAPSPLLAHLPAWGLRLAAAPRPADLEKLRHSAACRLTGVTGSAE